MTLANGEVFAGYTVDRLLGVGGMGEVYLARHPRLPRHDALKVLPLSVSSDEEFRARFEREADLAATLWHPHIVGVHDRGECDGRLWISMDYVDGTDSARLLAGAHPRGMPPAMVAGIVVAVAEALDYAHGRGMLHRDVKPANILLTGETNGVRRILLADFGIARPTGDDAGTTRTNMTVGSVTYTAPEQLMGDTLDGGADQYALAATAFHLLTGHPPFTHSNPAVLISRHLSTPAPAVSADTPALRPLDAVIAKALEKDPQLRYSSCERFAHALAGAAASLVGDAVLFPADNADATGTSVPPAPTTQLTAAPLIDGSGTAAERSSSPAQLWESHTAPYDEPPVVVSAWGQTQEASADEAAERLAVPTTDTPYPPAPGPRRVPQSLVIAAVTIGVCLVAAVTFAIFSGYTQQADRPDSAPPGVGSPTSTRAPTTTTRTTPAPTATRSTTTSVAAPSRQPMGGSYTIADYIRDNGIQETPTRRGDPGAPTLDLPFPAGWRDLGAQTPDWAFGGIVYDLASSDDPPTIMAILSKLEGNVDPAKILEYAPGELHNLTGFSGNDAVASTLGGYSATQAGGSYTKDGVLRAIAQKTVVIPGPSGIYVLQLNADGLYGDLDALMRATTVIDEQTTITPYA